MIKNRRLGLRHDLLVLATAQDGWERSEEWAKFSIAWYATDAELIPILDFLMRRFPQCAMRS